MVLVFLIAWSGVAWAESRALCNLETIQNKAAGREKIILRHHSIVDLPITFKTDRQGSNTATLDFHFENAPHLTTTLTIRG